MVFMLHPQLRVYQATGVGQMWSFLSPEAADETCADERIMNPSDKQQALGGIGHAQSRSLSARLGRLYRLLFEYLAPLFGALVFTNAPIQAIATGIENIEAPHLVIDRKSTFEIAP